MTLYSTNKDTNVSIPLFISDDDVFSRDNHSMFRIILIESGTGIFKINENSVVFMAPALLVLNEKDVVELVKECDVKARVLYFDPGIINSFFTIENIYDFNNFDKFTHIQDYFYLEPFISHAEITDNYFEIGITLQSRMSEFFKLIYKETNPCQGNFWVCRARSFFLEILFLIQYIYTDYQTENKIQLPKTTLDLNDVILYLHTNYQNKITIDDLTKVFHINRTTLSKKFHDATGMTIKDYLIKLRIKVSSVMLRDTNLSVSEIMYRAGFNEINHYGRMFKKYMGCSPSDYRNSCRREDV